MDEQKLYDEAMLEIDPILEDFPMDMYNGSPGSERTMNVLESEHRPSPVMGLLEGCSPSQESGMTSPQYGTCIDPDIFLNGVAKRESESEDSTSPHRNTPSPSDSNKSCDSYPSSGYASSGSPQMNNILFDSPPTSPENPVNPPQIVSIPNNSIIRVGAAQLPAIQKPLCPTNLSDLKKVKIPPKGSINVTGISSGGISKTISKKTIILTAKDYHALIRNMKSQPHNGPILIKTTPASAFAAAASKDKPVLPKPLQQTQVQSSLFSVEEAVPVQQTVASIPRPASAQTPVLLPTMGEPVNERVFKKHQRMIKNRESAYLSRVRKKEYVTSLEQRIDELTKENQYLKEENIGLLEKLKQKCSCHGGNRSGFGNFNVFNKQLTPNARKNTAIVLAMLFMVSFNFGPLGNLLTGSIRNHAELDTPDNTPHHQRNLLWIEDSNTFNARNVDMSLNLSNYDYLAAGAAEEPYAVCPFYVNQTENIRLASELRRWIGENGYKNLTDRDGDDMSINSFSEMFALKDTIDSMYRQMKDISSQMDAFQKRTRFTNGNKKRSQFKTKKSRGLEVYQEQKSRRQGDVALYYSGFSKKYAKFFEEIGRRDDTFYLVSFSGEHLLLPALAHNKTNRPKMSLMLPSMIDNATHPSDKVTLMQIDCEVMNTSMIQIREKTIPGDLLRSHAKADDNSRGNDKRTKSSTVFSDSNVQNVSSSGTAKENNRRYPKDPSTRPFFVQRMSEHMKSEYDLH